MPKQTWKSKCEHLGCRAFGTRHLPPCSISTLWILTGEQGRLSDWVVVMDTGGRISCSTRGEVGYIGETGWVEGLTMGRVSVKEDGEEMDLVDIVEVIEGIEDVGMKSG